LRSAGFTGFAPKQETWGLHLRPNPVCFADSKALIATFITREDVTALARRDQPGEPLPLRLHAIFLDAEAKKVQASKEWPITRPRGGVVAAGDGRFAVLTPAMIALYSPSLELVKDFRLSSEQQSHLWNFHVSSSGKSILVEYHYPEATYQWMNSDSLQPQDALWSESMPVLSISDEMEIASFRDTYVKATGSNIFEALIQPRNGAERTVCREFAGQAGSCGEPEFVSTDVVALLMPHGFNLVSKTGGDALLKASFRDDEWIGRPLHPSVDGKRFAVTVWAHKGGSAFLDISSHSVLKRIEIYDVSNPHPVYTLNAKQQKIKDVSGVTLSPDGSLMAILADGVVEVYQLPSGNSETAALKDGTSHLQVTIPVTKPEQ
jgi:WD40 repeat protein